LNNKIYFVLKVGRPGFDSLAESGQKTLKVGIFTEWATTAKSREGSWPPPWIFIDGTDKVKGGLMVLFLVLFFSLGLPQEIFLPTLRSWFTASLINVQQKKWIVWRNAGKFACCVLGQGT